MPFSALVALLLFWQGAAGSLDVFVVDGSNRPVSGVRVELKAEGTTVASTQTDESGRAAFRQLKLTRYELDALKDGFEPVQKADFELPASITLTLTPLARKESIEVKGAAAPLDAGASVPNEVPATDRRAASRTPRNRGRRPAPAARSGSRARRRPGDVGGRRTPQRAHRQLGGCHRPGHRTIRFDRAHRQRRDHECLPDAFPCRVRKIHGGCWFRWRPGAAATSGNGS